MFKRNLAFIIGINNYSNGISPLKTAVNDAKKLVEILREKHNYQVWVCLDEVATLSNLNQLLEKTLQQQVTENDRLLFYFAGHGVALNGDDGPAGYLIPQDAKRGDIDSYLPMTKLHDALSLLSCRHFLGVFDCCFAGAFRWSSTRDLLTTPEVIHKERYDRFIIDAAWQIITSSASDQKALDNFKLDTERGQVGNHSPFATALLEALEGQADVYPPAKNGKSAGDGVITATELYLYLRDRVEVPTEKHRLRQTPCIWCLNKHDKGEYIFLSPGHELNLPPAPPLDESKNPYRGLKSFDEEHSKLFFGRQALTQQLYRQVEKQPLTVVLGASGTGKSSLVKAGLIPYIKQSNPQWHILAPMRPGESPLKALNNTLATDELLVNSEHDIANWLQQNPQSKLVLIIDQVEELLTLCRNDQEREEFLNLLTNLVANYSDNLRIILTLRSDFEPQLSNSVLEPYWYASRFIVPAMTREELRACIEQPASARVMYFEPHSLVEKLVDEVAQMPGALPLLSFTLSELYLKYLKSVREGTREDRAITEADYEQLGGVTRSLTQRADYEHDQLVKKDTAYIATVRNLMLRMVAVGGGELARRRVALSELEYPEPENTRIQEAIARFTDARLLVEGQDSEGKPYVEPAHDALVRGWDKLLSWKQDEEEALILQRRLTSAAVEWQGVKSKQQISGFQAKSRILFNCLDRTFNTVENLFNKTTAQLIQLWKQRQNQQQSLREKPGQFLWNSNPYLDVLNEQLNFKQNWFNKLESEFVASSVLQKRRNISWRWRVTISVILGLTGLTIGLFFYLRSSQIREASKSRESAEISLENNQSLDGMITILQAGNILKQPLLQLFPPNIQLKEDIEGTLQKAVYTVRESNRLQGYTRPVRAVVFSPDGKYFATSGDDGTARLWNLQGKELLKFEQEKEKQKGSVRSIKFNPKANLVATAGDDGFIRLWNLQGKLIQQWNAQQGRLWGIEFSRDGNLVASEGNNGTVGLWNLQGKLSVELKGDQKPVKSLSFSPNGQLIASGLDDGTIRLWDVRGKELSKITAHKVSVSGLSFNPDSQLLASVGEDKFVRLWNVAGKQPILSKEWNAQQAKIWGVKFSPKGKQLATGGGDGTVKVWNLQGEELEKFVAHRGPVRSVSFSPKGEQLASSSDDTMVRIWDLQGKELNKFENKNFGNQNQNQNNASSVSLSTNGKKIVTADNDGFIRLWNQNGQLLGKPFQHSGTVKSLALSPDNQQIIIGNNDGGIELRKSNGQILRKPFKDGSSPIRSVAFSPDAQKIISGSEDGIIRLWNLQGKLLGKLFEGHLGAVNSLGFSPNSQRIVSGGEDGTIRLWDLQSEWNRAFQIYGPEITSVTFSPDSKKIISSDSKGRILLWNLQNPTDQLPYSAWNTKQSAINSISISSDGKLLTTLGSDGSVKLWEIHSSDQLMKQACNSSEDYLKNNSNEGDSNLCDGINK
ncbi:caspase family protein [Calothrix sp. CCY 0018]|uniref:nSTAND1 domain-containing NTPase n=1 Tax=Calothrix sp. CCY 0018 TaxID=3103864 RepID=UPI0039C68177